LVYGQTINPAPSRAVATREGKILFEGVPGLVYRGDRPLRFQSPEGRLIFSADDGARKSGGAFSRVTLWVKSDRERVLNLFPFENELIKRGTLSGGEQMLAIARALMARPRLLLDEPSMGLAPMLVTQIFSIIRDINAQGTTILLVEQNARMALTVANRGCCKLVRSS